jgi:membrane protease YdiL (CAAX protease family)
MEFDTSAFEAYRASAGGKTTLPRLIGGSVLIVICWVAVTAAVVFAGFYFSHDPDLASVGGFMGTPLGVLVSLSSFAGIWIGVWAAMRFVHKEKLRTLFGAAGRLSWPAFAKGLAAVLVTSLFSEVLIYGVSPDIQRGPIAWGTWALFLVPVLALAFVQTSAEEILFRGYLLRGLAHRYANPLVWGVVPALLFTCLHWNAGAPFALNACILVSIGSFAALLTMLVYATGNLGAGMGAHLGNNIGGFLLISHERSFSSFSLYSGRPLEEMAWTGMTASLFALIAIVSCALTYLLLVHPRSPLRVTGAGAGTPTRPAGAAAI